MESKQLLCSTCSVIIPFTVKDQEFYKLKNWPTPMHCKKCYNDAKNKKKLQANSSNNSKWKSQTKTLIEAPKNDAYPLLKKDSLILGKIDKITSKGLEIRINENQGLTMLGFIDFRFYYNYKLDRLFIVDDEITVIVLSHDKSKLTLCPSKEYVRPLVILDVNGVLGEREPFDENNPTVLRKFFPRPYVKEFLQFCAEKFELALWTCASFHKDGELDIFPSGNFIFDWNKNKATNLWPRTSAVSVKKPLFLKELSIVWSEFPCYDSSNTLLVDDHIEKFERNPQGTCAVIPRYIYQNTDKNTDNTISGHADSVLKPENSFCSLLNYVYEKKSNFQDYFASLIGKSEYFFPHPISPELSPESATNSDSSFLEFFGPTCTFFFPEKIPTLDFCRQRFLGSACTVKKNISIRLKNRTLPGPRTTVLLRSNLDTISTGKFLVCEKTDGLRALLMICPKEKLIFIIGRSLEVTVLYSNGGIKEIDDWMKIQHGDTILDGELVHTYFTKSNEKKIKFLVFDGIITDGEKVGLLEDLYKRLEIISQFVNRLNQSSSVSSYFPFSIVTKNLVQVQNLKEIISKFRISSIDNSWRYYSSPDVDQYHNSDGLVFSPVGRNYYDNLAMKWKPLGMLSVDFSAPLANLKEIFLDAQKGSFETRFPGSCMCAGTLMTLSLIGLTKSEDMTALKSIWEISQPDQQQQQQQVIVECVYEPAFGIWRPIRLRKDKHVPNSVQTAWSTLEAVTASISIDILLNTLGLSNDADCFEIPYLKEDLNINFEKMNFNEFKLYEFENSVILKAKSEQNDNQSDLTSDAVVEEHYDHVQYNRNLNKDIGKDKRLDMLRKVNNWVKASLNENIRTSTPNPAILSPLSNEQVDMLLSRLESHAKALFENDKNIYHFIDYDLKYKPNVHPDSITKSEPSHPQKNNFKQNKKKNSHRINVLDICCGRGGELNKLAKEYNVDAYVGIDLSILELQEAEARFHNLNRSFQNPLGAVFINGDASSIAVENILNDLLLGSTLESEKYPTKAYNLFPKNGFDFVICHFALHYFCNEEIRLQQILNITSKNLKSGHRFCVTFPNPYFVELCLKFERNSIGDICHIVKSLHSDIAEKEFGREYLFTLGDAVQNCIEYVVPIRRLIELAESDGLKVVDISPVQDRVVTMSQDINYLSQREVMGIIGAKSPQRDISDDEWRSIGVYCLLTFEKL